MTRQEWQSTGVVMAVLFAGYGAFAQPTPTIEETMRADRDVELAVAGVRQDVQASGVVPREYQTGMEESERAYREVLQMETKERREGEPIEPAADCGDPVIEDGALPEKVLGRAHPDECRIVLDETKLSEFTPAQRCTILVHEKEHLKGRDHEEGGLMDPTPLSDGFIAPECQ